MELRLEIKFWMLIRHICHVACAFLYSRTKKRSFEQQNQSCNHWNLAMISVSNWTFFLLFWWGRVIDTQTFDDRIFDTQNFDAQISYIKNSDAEYLWTIWILKRYEGIQEYSGLCCLACCLACCLVRCLERCLSCCLVHSLAHSLACYLTLCFGGIA